MIKIKIKNYESIRDAEIEINGFTSFIGNNHLGKSSVLRAINAALTNQQGMDFISWGESYCEVSIKTEGLDLKWHKEKGNNFYEINKKVYKKIGRDSAPKEVEEAGFKLLNLDGEKINLNYSEQFFPLFLVNRMDSKAADLITSIYGLDRIYKAISLCNVEQRKNKDLLRLRQTDLDMAERDLAKFDGFEDVESDIDALKKSKRDIDASEKTRDHLVDLYTRILTTNKEYKSLKPIEDVALPDNKDIEKTISDYNKISGYEKNLTYVKQEVSHFKKVSDISLVPDTDSIAKDIDIYKDISDRYKRLKSLSQQQKRLKAIEGIELPQIEIDGSELNRLQEYLDILLSHKELIQGFKKELDGLKKSLAGIEEDLKSYDNCPLCGSPRNV